MSAGATAARAGATAAAIGRNRGCDLRSAAARGSQFAKDAKTKPPAPSLHSAPAVIPLHFALGVVTESEMLQVRLLLFGGEVFLGFADQIEAAGDADQVFL